MGGGNKNCTKNILGVLSLKLEMVILSENSKFNDLWFSFKNILVGLFPRKFLQGPISFLRINRLGGILNFSWNKGVAKVFISRVAIY